MWCGLVLWSLVINIFVETEGGLRNDTGLLISKYAKVAHYRTNGNGAQTDRNVVKIPSNHR